MKLYLIDLYEAYSAYEKGVNAVRNLPEQTINYKHELLEEAEVQLPAGFTIATSNCGSEEIYLGDEAAEMVTDYNGGRFVTELVTSKGTVTLHEWNYGYSDSKDGSAIHDIEEANVLVEYSANMCTSDRVAKVFGKELSDELSNILADFQREWDEVEVDEDGATPEQDAELDAFLDKYQRLINAL